MVLAKLKNSIVFRLKIVNFNSCKITVYCIGVLTQWLLSTELLRETKDKRFAGVLLPIDGLYSLQLIWREYMYIMKTSSCNVYPLTPHFYLVKLGFTGEYIIFLFFSLKHIFNEAVLTCPPNICFEQKYENSQKSQLKIVIFTAVNNRSILHGRVFVMYSEKSNKNYILKVVILVKFLPNFGSGVLCFMYCLFCC